VLILSLLSINFEKGTVPFVNMLLHLWMLFLLLPIVAFGDDTNVVSDPIVMGYLYTALLLVIAPYVFNSQQTVGHSSPHIRRQRRDVSSMFHELGPIYSRRAYRMDTDSFWALHRLLRPHLKGRVRPASLRSKKKCGAVNGVIPSTIRLSIALRVKGILVKGRTLTMTSIHRSAGWHYLCNFIVSRRIASQQRIIEGHGWSPSGRWRRHDRGSDSSISQANRK
jgi:hypothetical protein